MSEVTTKWIIKIGDEEHEFDWKKILNAEAIAIEKATHITWSQFLVGMIGGPAVSQTAALWIMRKRKDPKLRFEDVVFSMGDFQLIDPDEDDPEPEAELPELAEPVELSGDTPQELPKASAQEE
jgi:hypothetical protein